MATLGVGVDIVDVERFAAVLTRHPRIVERLFTDQERIDTKLRPERLAARFAAKEAVMKTLGVGVGATTWQSIEIVRSPEGAPDVLLHGNALELAARRGVDELKLSMSHSAITAAAFVVGSSSETRGV